MFREVAEACFKHKRYHIFWRELNVFLDINLNQKYLDKSLNLFEVVAEQFVLYFTTLNSKPLHRNAMKEDYQIYYIAC